jgi:hypothetical protein
MNKAEKILSTLAWTKADYEQAGEEVPDELLEDDFHTEGELMSREDIDQWLRDTHRTFLVLGENSSDHFHKLYDEFEVDVLYLKELGKILPDEAEALLNKDNFTF